jgi:hypothetical protein
MQALGWDDIKSVHILYFQNSLAHSYGVKETWTKTNMAAPLQGWAARGRQDWNEPR